MRALLLALLLLPCLARAEALRDRFSAGGYFRIMTRPDFQGGDSKLGYWNLYGRLLNEGPWGALELKLDILQNNPARAEAWASVHAKIEGGSFANTDPGRGNLARYAATQLYLKAGSLLLEHVTWQMGTLDSYLGILGLYDMRPAQLFFETVGLAATYDIQWLELLVAVGDDGWAYRGADYSTMLTAGGWARLRFAGHLELALGGQYRFEPEVKGNRHAPYATPGVRYEDYVRREVVQRWLEENPGQESLFPNPASTASQSYKLVGSLAFGGFGPLRWNSLFVSFSRLHPESSYVERSGGRDYTIFVQALTDQRYQWTVGNEAHLTLVPEWLDAIWSVLYGRHTDLDNTIAPGENNRTYYSTVARLQLYATPTVHLIAESSLARERSDLGNAFRQHFDSVFENTRGVPDSRGLERGDSPIRDTWQLKGGIVLNPTGRGIFTRPSLRLLGGLQYSSQQAAYGNAFVENLDQYNVFAGTESHWHTVVAIESEAWF